MIIVKSLMKIWPTILTKNIKQADPIPEAGILQAVELMQQGIPRCPESRHVVTQVAVDRSHLVRKRLRVQVREPEVVVRVAQEVVDAAERFGRRCWLTRCWRGQQRQMARQSNLPCLLRWVGVLPWQRIVFNA